jgi:hypothetical protein
VTPDRVDPAAGGTRIRPRWWWVAAVVAGLVYAWIAAGFRAFTATENVMVAVPIAIVLVLAASHGSDRHATESVAVLDPPQRGAVVWVALLVVLVAWELLALFSSPREDHPTLSSVADTIMSVHIGRAAMVAVWLAAGAGLAMAGSRGRR